MSRVGHEALTELLRHQANSGGLGAIPRQKLTTTRASWRAFAAFTRPRSQAVVASHTYIYLRGGAAAS
jgi:hypothetical protein